MTEYTISNNKGISANILDYGGRISSLFVPDAEGRIADIVLGFERVEDYLSSNEIFYGAAIGRYGNRIANGSFTLDGKTYQLTKNNGSNSLHGGIKGFHNVIWEVKQINESSLGLHYLSMDGEEGFPGNLDVRILYSVTGQNELKIEYFANSDKRTVVNLTHHSFFNLSGDPGRSIEDHILEMNADHFTPVNKDQIPTGKIQAVEHSPFDFRRAKAIGRDIGIRDEQLEFGKGYDHNWVINRNGHGDALVNAAVVTDPLSGRCMEVNTNEPGIQFYSGNFLDGSDRGKGDVKYDFRTAFCLETQHFPDSPNQKGFPATILDPGEEYYSVCIYKFSAL